VQARERHARELAESGGAQHAQGGSGTYDALSDTSLDPHTTPSGPVSPIKLW
jgi:hypothetical protein